VDIEEVVISGFAGLWSSEALGEVLDFRENGKLGVYSGTGDYTGSYKFDLDNGKGAIELAEDKYTFTVGWDTLNVDEVGSYLRADKKLDIAVFVSQHANPLVATWYDTTGVYGTMTFYADYTFDLVMYGQTLTGTYTFSPADGTGTVTISQTGDTAEMTYADGSLILDGMTFTQTFVQQPGAEEIFAAVEGVWYDMEGTDETVTFYNDGRIDVNSGGQYYTGTFTFDPFELAGTITIEYMGEITNAEFLLSADMLVIDSYYYTREVVMLTGSILGTWYDIEGMQGTLYFDKDGLAIMDSFGTMFYGTYTFDQSTGIGSMTLEFVEGPFTWSLYLVDTKLATDDATYTQDYVEQTTETNAG
jgi:hypothetical protein